VVRYSILYPGDKDEFSKPLFHVVLIKLSDLQNNIAPSFPII